MNINTFLELSGTIAFAVSGTNTASEKRMDIFGCLVIAFVSAVGGGSLRDLLLGIQPVSWIQDNNTIIAVSIGCLLAYFFKKRITKLRKTLFLFDTIGISLFTVIGINKALLVGVNPAVALMMGISSAVFGGVLRDVLCNEIPLIFKQEVYATACLAGGLLYLFLRQLGISEPFDLIATSAFIFCIRILAVKYKWTLHF